MSFSSNSDLAVSRTQTEQAILQFCAYCFSVWVSMRLRLTLFWYNKQPPFLDEKLTYSICLGLLASKRTILHPLTWRDGRIYVRFCRDQIFNQIFFAMARLSRARAPLKLFWYPNYSIVLVHFIGVFLVKSFVVTSLLNHVTLRMSNDIL